MLCSFLELSHIPWCGHTTLFTQLSLGERLGGLQVSFFQCSFIMNVSVQAVHGHKLIVLWSTDLGAELLGHVVPLSSTIGGTTMPSAQVMTEPCLPTSSRCIWLLFLCILAHSHYFHSLKNY